MRSQTACSALLTMCFRWKKDRNPALQRMLVKGWVKACWGTTAGNRRARYYQLTALGGKQLELELSQFEGVIGAINRAIQMA